MNLRSMIKKKGINCLPWRVWRGEIELLPISSQTLFKRDGIPIDLLEIELVTDGYLFKGESLLEVLKNQKNLFRVPFSDQNFDEIGDFPEDWTDEDYIFYYERKGNENI